MNMSKDLKTELLDILRKIEHFDKLKFIYLYGSRSKRKHSKRSDIDICLYYDLKNEKQLFKLLFKIRGLLPDKFDVQMFQLLPLFVKKEIFGGKLIFSKDIKFVYDLAYSTFKDFQEFEPRYRFYIFNTKTNPNRVVI